MPQSRRHRPRLLHELVAAPLGAGIGLPLALVWIAHIGFDRALGYGLKYPSAFADTHLGRIERAATARA